MNQDTNANYLTNSLSAAKQFVQRVASNLSRTIEQKPWGAYKSDLGPFEQTVKHVAQNPQYVTQHPSEVASAAIGDVLTNATRQQIWKYTNLHRVVNDTSQRVSSKLGLESTLGGAVVAAAVPIGISMLSGQSGSLLSGLRPAGYKAVAPVSKEKDPSGRTSQSPLLEASLRYGLGQRSQLLPYSEFKEERPDVLPSTYVNYKRYQNMRPEAGQWIRVDPAGRSFSTIGGIVRGTATGLNDPELRVKGVPVTASAVLGTAAGLGTTRGLAALLNPETTFDPAIKELKKKVRVASETAKYAAAEGSASQAYVQDVVNKQSLLDAAVKARYDTLTPVAKQFQKLGGLKDPTLIAAGVVTAGIVAHTAKKLFQKAEEGRVKKENPVEYLKQKHGTFEQAKAALEQPTARSWSELAPYVQ